MKFFTEKIFQQLIHGWPGSIREFYEIIPLLTTPSKDNIAFEVIAPSLPGFGFSAGSAKRGLGPEKIAVVFRNLMLRVGLDKFYIQAGDWVNIFIMIKEVSFKHLIISRVQSSGVIYQLCTPKMFVAITPTTSASERHFQ